jgi:hypothetical protein
LAGPDHPDFVYVHFIRSQRKSSGKTLAMLIPPISRPKTKR